MFFIFIIYFINKCLCEKKRFITIPFKIQQENSYSSKDYNPDIFLYNNFYKNYTFSFSIGNPMQKVDGIIMEDNLCFELKLLDDIDNKKEYIKSSNNKYSPKDSSAFSLNHKELKWTKGEYQTIASDLFHFDGEANKNYNMSLLLKKSDDSNININDIKNKKYIIKFGLNVQTSFSGDECPNFMIYLWSKVSISKYLSSFIFNNSKEGILVIGDELYKYNPKKYNESHYKGVYSFKYNSFNYDHGLIYDSQNKSYITMNKSEAYIKYNYGIIIGTEEYKQKIDEMFFNKLISDNICRIQLTKLNESSEYYIYICNEKTDLSNFPKLAFLSRYYRFSFELNYQDLFIKKYDNNLYFLILFNSNKESNQEWILGEPFYKKYTFSFNIDARIVGFYDKIFDNETKVEDNEVNSPKNNKSIIVVILIILGVIFVIALMVLSFYFGMKLKEKRKIRANELKDEDNYEYFPESEKENNKIIN